MYRILTEWIHFPIAKQRFSIVHESAVILLMSIIVATLIFTGTYALQQEALTKWDTTCSELDICLGEWQEPASFAVHMYSYNSPQKGIRNPDYQLKEKYYIQLLFRYKEREINGLNEAQLLLYDPVLPEDMRTARLNFFLHSRANILPPSEGGVSFFALR